MPTIKYNNAEIRLCGKCIVCGESAELTSTENCNAMHGQMIIKICDECKEAILKMREQMKGAEE